MRRRVPDERLQATIDADFNSELLRRLCALSRGEPVTRPTLTVDAVLHAPVGPRAASQPTPNRAAAPRRTQNTTTSKKECNKPQNNAQFNTNTGVLIGVLTTCKTGGVVFVPL